jgi:uncharacterized membrane protein YhdT
MSSKKGGKWNFELTFTKIAWLVCAYFLSTITERNIGKKY